MDTLKNIFLAPGGEFDVLAVLFIVGSLAMLYGIWRVLRHDLDLTATDDEVDPPVPAVRGRPTGPPRKPRKSRKAA